MISSSAIPSARQNLLIKAERGVQAASHVSNLALCADIDTLLAMTGLDCVTALKALGEDTRLRILRILLKEPLSVNEISTRLKVSQYNVSKHLRIMRDARILESRKHGKQRLYGVPVNLQTHLANNDNTLDLGCCTFRFDKLPR